MTTTNCTFKPGAVPGGFSWVAFINRDEDGPGSVVVGICDGRCLVPDCDGVPNGFFGGELTVDLQPRTSAMGKFFFLAHNSKEPAPTTEPSHEAAAIELEGGWELVPTGPKSTARRVPFWMKPEENPRSQFRRPPDLLRR